MASPRASITAPSMGIRSPSSTTNTSARSSFSADPSSTAASATTAGPAPAHPTATAPTSRRNHRSALRDYYNLKTGSVSGDTGIHAGASTTHPTASSASGTTSQAESPTSGAAATSPVKHQQQPPTPKTPTSAASAITYSFFPSIDSHSSTAENNAKAHQQHSSPADANTYPTNDAVLTPFNPQSHITSLLSRASLAETLQAESALISEIRGLDGERKALVYDNYSRLIRATETIRGLIAGEMEGVGGRVGGLEGDVRRMGKVVGDLVEGGGGGSEDGEERDADGKEGKRSEEREKEKLKAQAKTVKWVLEAPQRIAAMVEEGRGEDARRMYEESVRPALEKWDGVGGVEKVRKCCEDALGSKGAAEDHG
ncbi:MAG: hypothetical protein M1831_005713 [Alyxoria varia]|nr:MAG: hypothetical protein M1831_005713 [Alyxoria varia]